MTIREWIRNKEICGKTVFSLGELRESFPQLSNQVILNNLARLRREKVIYSPYSSLYVALPPQYVLRGAVPSYYFMDALMKEQKRSYYFGLLSAASLWGAPHQRPQTDFVVATPPRLFVGNSQKRSVKWLYRETMPSRFLCQKPGEAGPVIYSNAELTALDLVQFEQHAGGLSAVATVIGELLESTDFKGASEGLFSECKNTVIRRLGYIVEKVIGDEKQGAVIFSELSKVDSNWHYAALSPRGLPSDVRDDRWKLTINARIEVDDI